jgi:hypothetical protein
MKGKTKITLKLKDTDGKNLSVIVPTEDVPALRKMAIRAGAKGRAFRNSIKSGKYNE